MLAEVEDLPLCLEMVLMDLEVAGEEEQVMEEIQEL